MSRLQAAVTAALGLQQDLAAKVAAIQIGEVKK